MVRQRPLEPPSVGSNPTTPATHEANRIGAGQGAFWSEFFRPGRLVLCKFFDMFFISISEQSLNWQKVDSIKGAAAPFMLKHLD